MPSILLFGVTGLVGSHLVLALKKSYPNLPVTVYLRNPKFDTYLTETANVKRIVHVSSHILVNLRRKLVETATETMSRRKILRLPYRL
jgi:nucleoside-diphosphate-sugar epimerase